MEGKQRSWNKKYSNGLLFLWKSLLQNFGHSFSELWPIISEKIYCRNYQMVRLAKAQNERNREWKTYSNFKTLPNWFVIRYGTSRNHTIYNEKTWNEALWENGKDCAYEFFSSKVTSSGLSQKVIYFGRKTHH